MRRGMGENCSMGTIPFPDRGSRVFVPSKKSFGKVIEITPVEPELGPERNLQNTIYYLVELDSGERLGFTLEQILISDWVGDQLTE